MSFSAALLNSSSAPALREALVHLLKRLQNLIAARKAAKLDLIMVDLRLAAVRQQEPKAQKAL